jgi:hypothetical protein
MRQALLEHGVSTERAQRLVETMREVFEEAEVDEDEIARLEPAMTNEAGDRHVLACAVAADSELVVTSNLAHFPARRATPSAWNRGPGRVPSRPLRSRTRRNPGCPRGAGVRPKPAVAARGAARRTRACRRASFRRGHPSTRILSGGMAFWQGLRRSGRRTASGRRRRQQILVAAGAS